MRRSYCCNVRHMNLQKQEYYKIGKSNNWPTKISPKSRCTQLHQRCLYRSEIVFWIKSHWSRRRRLVRGLRRFAHFARHFLRFKVKNWKSLLQRSTHWLCQRLGWCYQHACSTTPLLSFPRWIRSCVLLFCANSTTCACSICCQGDLDGYFRATFARL